MVKLWDLQAERAAKIERLAAWMGWYKDGTGFWATRWPNGKKYHTLFTYNGSDHDCRDWDPYRHGGDALSLLTQARDKGWTVGITSDIPTPDGPQWRVDLHRESDGAVADGFHPEMRHAICAAVLAASSPPGETTTEVERGE